MLTPASIEPTYRIVVHVRDTAEKPGVLRLKFNTMAAAIGYAFEIAQRLQGTSESWLTPRDFVEDPLYARFVPFHAIDEIGVEEEVVQAQTKTAA